MAYPDLTLSFAEAAIAWQLQMMATELRREMVGKLDPAAYEATAEVLDRARAEINEIGADRLLEARKR